MAESQASRNTVVPKYCGVGPGDHVFPNGPGVCQCGRQIYKPLTEQEQYFRELEKRLKAGAEAYGDSSFGKSENSLLKEIQEEILDIAGWSYILWAKIERLKSSIDK